MPSLLCSDASVFVLRFILPCPFLPCKHNAWAHGYLAFMQRPQVHPCPGRRPLGALPGCPCTTSSPRMPAPTRGPTVKTQRPHKSTLAHTSACTRLDLVDSSCRGFSSIYEMGRGPSLPLVFVLVCIRCRLGWIPFCAPYLCRALFPLNRGHDLGGGGGSSLSGVGRAARAALA